MQSIPASLLDLFSRHHKDLGLECLADTFHGKYIERGGVVVGFCNSEICGVETTLWEVYAPAITSAALAERCWQSVRDLVWEEVARMLPIDSISMAEDNRIALVRFRAIGESRQAASGWIATDGMTRVVPAAIRLAERIVSQLTVSQQARVA